MSDYLRRKLPEEFAFRYYVLDRAEFDEQFCEQEHCTPRLMANGDGVNTIHSLVRVDCLDAQRHLSDSGSKQHGAGRSENLSTRLSRFYQNNLDQRADDHMALKALFGSVS